MSPRDYKNSARQSQRDEHRPGSWLSFVSGLGVGLVIALGVYLWSGSLPPPAALLGSMEQKTTAEPAYDRPEPEPAADSAPMLPRPTFDFYKILPEMEVPVPDWELSGRDEREDSGLSRGTYVLQVGSFKRFEDADRAKARLALRGISAQIQRVVINGQDVWFRVHVGPFSEEAEIRAMRLKLIENGTDFILLRIGGPDAA